MTPKTTTFEPLWNLYVIRDNHLTWLNSGIYTSVDAMLNPERKYFVNGTVRESDVYVLVSPLGEATHYKRVIKPRYVMEEVTI